LQRRRTPTSGRPRAPITEEKQTMADLLELVKRKDPHEREFHQALQGVLSSVQPLLDQNHAYPQAGILERITEPERIITFRVPWMDGRGKVRVNRGYMVEMSNAVGPFKGGLRFHPSVNQSILKFLAFEQVFKNALTTLPLGGAGGGADFDPKGKSDAEVMEFCQSFMKELFRHIGPCTDIPGSDIGVGSREIGYLFGMYRKLKNEFSGALTGKGIGWGGSLFRQEAVGYGAVYFAAEMMNERWNLPLEGRTCLVSGSGKVALSTTEKLIDLGAKVLTLSDSNGYVYDSEGLNRDKLEFVKRLKNIRRGRIEEYIEKYPSAVYTSLHEDMEHNPLWNHRAECAFPAATQNEINLKDAYHLINNNVRLICECASMPCTAQAVEIFLKKNILYAPGKAANAGGAAVSGLEMTQNSTHLPWSLEELDRRLEMIMKNIHTTCLEAAQRYGCQGNYAVGANIAAFSKVADAMLDQGLL